MRAEKKDDQKRKIAREEWPEIASRFRNGESLASIGRSYGCSAPAVRYIVRKEAPEAYAQRQAAPRARPVARILAAGASEREVVQERRPERQSTFDPEFRKKITGEVSEFLVAVDAVTAGGTPEDFERLRNVTDRVLRLAAWTRVELERITKERQAK